MFCSSDACLYSGCAGHYLFDRRCSWCWFIWSSADMSQGFPLCYICQCPLGVKSALSCWIISFEGQVPPGLVTHECAPCPKRGIGNAGKGLCGHPGPMNHFCMCPWFCSEAVPITNLSFITDLVSAKLLCLVNWPRAGGLELWLCKNWGNWTAAWDSGCRCGSLLSQDLSAPDLASFSVGGVKTEYSHWETNHRVLLSVLTTTATLLL